MKRLLLILLISLSSYTPMNGAAYQAATRRFFSHAQQLPKRSIRLMGSWKTGDESQIDQLRSSLENKTSSRSLAQVPAVELSVQKPVADNRSYYKDLSVRMDLLSLPAYEDSTGLNISSLLDYGYMPQEAFGVKDTSRIQEGSSISSMQTYVPDAYDDLNVLQKKLESPEVYADFQQQYEDLKKEGVTVKRFTYPVDGQEVVGFALLPKDDGKKHPLVLSFRGGFNGRDMFHEWAKIDLPWIMRHYAFLAKNGYAVLASQYRNAEGNKNKDEFGGADVNDIIALFDVAEDLGSIDLSDIRLNAFSRGTVMLGQTLDRLKEERPEIYNNIKAAVIKGGISDLETFVNDDPKYIKPILEQARDDFSQRQDEILKEISLVRKPHVLQHIPTLIMHNEQDNVVPATLSKNLTKALQEQGVEHETVFFPSKHHQILEHNDEVQTRTLDWFEKHKK